MRLDFSKVRLFSKKTEKIFLFYPLFFLALVPMELIFFNSTIGGTDKFIRRMLTNVLFLDATHVLLTYVVLLRIPELKTWTKDKTSLTSTWFYIRLVLIFGILLTYFNYSWPENNVPWEFEVVTFIIAFMPFQHSLYQVRGLSLAYNSGVRTDLYKNQKDEAALHASLEKLKLSERWEKTAFALFFFGIVGMRIINKPDNFFTKTVFSANLSLSNWVFSAVLFAAIFSFLRSLYLLGFANLKWSGKSIHLSRLIAYPLVSVSLVAADLVSIFHGVDYYLVTRKMISTSNSTSQERATNLLIINTTLVISGLLFIALSYWRYAYQSETIIPNSLLFLNGFVAAISYLHYYLDRIIFRMRDADSRRIVAPLIAATSSEI